MKFISVMIICSAVLIFLGCAAEPKDSPVDEFVEDEADILPRPRFEKPVLRPLGRVLLSWTKIDNADGYEIQISDSEDFSVVLKTWTVNGTNLELPHEQGITRWYRVRSFTQTQTSRWSAILRLDDKEL